MRFGWEGKRIRLVPLEKERHLFFCTKWVNDTKLTEFTCIGDYPLNSIAEENFIDHVSSLQENPTRISFAVETLAGEPIGLCGLNEVSYRHGHAEIGYVLGEKTFQRKGLGTEMVSLLTAYAFEVVGLRLVRANVFPENVPSVKILLKLGYVECGRIPQYYWKRGQYRDELIFCCFHASFKAASSSNP